MIDRLQARYLARAFEDARRAGLERIIVHIDTDGGAVGYAREMFKTVLDPPGTRGGPAAAPAGEEGDGVEAPDAAQGPGGADYDPRMIAFVDFRAISAGAMIAYAHHDIYVTEAASIGDIGVIFQKSDGTMEYAPEKIETVVRTLLAQAAERRGWPRGLLLKMTARNQKVYRITPPGGETTYVIEDDLPAWLADHPEVDKENSAHMVLHLGEDRLLTLTGREAVSFGMASGLVDDLAALYASLGIEPEDVVDLSPLSAESMAAWLSRIAPLLLGLAMLLLFFELNTPGVGLWAILAATFGGLFLFSHYYLDLAEHFEVALLLIGLALIAAEALVFPTGGIVAVAGGICVLAGVVLAFLPNEIDFAPSEPQFQGAFVEAALSGFLGIGIAALGLMFLFKVLPHTRGIRARVTVAAEIAGTSDAAGPSLVGRTGRAQGMLRPAGTIVVGGIHHSARAEHGTWIAAGETVRIISAELGELVVRAVPSAEDTSPSS